MDEQISGVLEGTIGWFWPGYDGPGAIDAEPERGYIRLSPPGTLELTALDENVDREDDVYSRRPRLITGATERGGLVLLDVKGAGRKSRFGGAAASVRHYRARTLLSGVPIDRVRSDLVSSVSAHFLGVSRWFGVSTVSESSGRSEEGLLRSFTISVESQPEQVVGIPGGREIAISAHWAARGSSDRRTISAPIELTCRSTGRPKPLWALRHPLLRIQDLLSFCYGGFLVADGGLARPDLGDKKAPEFHLWDEWLMVTHAGVSAADQLDFPLLSMQNLGGIQALRRWITLCTTHLRAVRPMIEPFRQGRTSSPLRMLEIAAAMEYWVAAHRRTSSWTKEKCCKKGSQGCGWVWPIASLVGSTFEGWVGEVRKWSHLFWSTYNKLKHEPEYEIDEYNLRVLADSGALLLSVALLCRVSGNKEPARLLFGDTSHTWQLQRQVHELLA